MMSASDSSKIFCSFSLEVTSTIHYFDNCHDFAKTETRTMNKTISQTRQPACLEKYSSNAHTSIRRSFK